MPSKFEEQKREIGGICQRMGIDFKELANRAAVKPETMRKWAKGYQVAPQPMMEAFRNIEQMQKLHSVPVISVDKGNFFSEREKKKGLGQKIPVVSFARAGEPGFDYHDLANQMDEWMVTDCKDPNAFALRLENDSMETKYLPGDLIVFAPNTSPRNGQVVVAKLRDDDSVLFKLYHEFGPDAGMVRLTSFNRAYPPLEFPKRKFRFIYPMYEMRRK